jgi:pimeloyl-ACP methyl ester carboxylesterase
VVYDHWICQHNNSIADMVGPLLKPIMIQDIFDVWDSFSEMPHITCGALFMSGRQDQLVPPYMMNSLHDHATASSLRRFVAFPKGEHNNTMMAPGYFDHVYHHIYIRAAVLLQLLIWCVGGV